MEDRKYPPRYLHTLVEAGYYTRAGALRRIKASMTAYNKAGRFDEAIEFGSKYMEEFSDERVLRNLVINAYIGRAERALMLGESYKEDYLKALSLDPQNETLKRRLIYLGVINKNGNSVSKSNIQQYISARLKKLMNRDPVILQQILNSPPGIHIFEFLRHCPLGNAFERELTRRVSWNHAQTEQRKIKEAKERLRRSKVSDKSL